MLIGKKRTVRITVPQLGTLNAGCLSATRVQCGALFFKCHRCVGPGHCCSPWWGWITRVSVQAAGAALGGWRAYWWSFPRTNWCLSDRISEHSAKVLHHRPCFSIGSSFPVCLLPFDWVVVLPHMLCYGWLLYHALSWMLWCFLSYFQSLFTMLNTTQNKKGGGSNKTAVTFWMMTKWGFQFLPPCLFGRNKEY